MRKKLLRYLGPAISFEWSPHLGELLLLKCVLLLMHKSKKLLTRTVSAKFDELYLQLNAGNNSITLDRPAIDFIKREAYKGLSQAGFIKTGLGHMTFTVHKKLRKQLPDSDCKMFLVAIDCKLELYVKNSRKIDWSKRVVEQVDSLMGAFYELDKYYRLQYDNALKIDANAAQPDEQQIMDKIHKWQNTISTLQLDIKDTLQVQQKDIADDVKSPSEQLAHALNSLVALSATKQVNLVELLKYNKMTPLAMTLLGDRMDVSSWDDLWRSFCETILINKPYIVAGLDRDTTINSQDRMFSYIQSEIKNKPFRLANGMYTELGCDGAMIVYVCRYIILLCGYRNNDLVIEYQEDGSDRA